jgi:choline dehydrogenase
VHASREIVVCAGAINTPQLLQLSGVGPGRTLQEMGIPVVADRPAVGAHLQDHLCIDYLYRSRVPSLNEALRPWRGRLRAGVRYLATRRGPLAMSVNQAGGFVRSRAGLDRPNLQLYFSPLSYTRAQPGQRRLLAPDPFPGFLLSAQPCRPTSRGRIRLRSPDPLAAPAIEPNSLSAQHDLDELVEGALFLRRLAAAPSLAQVIAQELSPGPAVTSRDDVIADIRARASSVFHPVGTCRMGPDARDAVVDARLRAHGLPGLRIVDASVFPTLTSGNTNTPVLMVAERGAEMILQDAA